MSRTSPRTFTVLGKTKITPHMLRVTLGGNAMADFPSARAGAYVKLRFAQTHSRRPLLRTYTIRARRADSIDIDFVLHEHGGPASRWAERVKPGETIDLGEPGPGGRVDPAADWFLLIGDMSALPAITAHLEHLPSNARGRAVIEVMDETDIQPLVASKDIAIDWLINPRPGTNSDALCDKIRALPWAVGRPSIWAACEFAGTQKLRAYLKNERGITRDQLYISSYWQLAGVAS